MKATDIILILFINNDEGSSIHLKNIEKQTSSLFLFFAIRLCYEFILLFVKTVTFFT